MLEQVFADQPTLITLLKEAIKQRGVLDSLISEANQQKQGGFGKAKQGKLETKI